LSHASSPFSPGYFRGGVSGTICTGWRPDLSQVLSS
jgi:hypothetical protein